MTTKYGVYNPQKGEYDLFKTKEEALEAFWLRVIATAKEHYHNTAYTTIHYNEDGTETWLNESEQEINKKRTLNEIKAILKHEQTEILAKAQQVKVERFP